MSKVAARILSSAIRAGARRHEERTGRRVYRGVITSLAPLGVDLEGLDLSLDAQDIQLSQDVERYKASEGLHVGDGLALLEVDDGDWIAVTVISDTAVRTVPT
jgi:hypothetical protein